MIHLDDLDTSDHDIYKNISFAVYINIKLLYTINVVEREKGDKP